MYKKETKVTGGNISNAVLQFSHDNFHTKITNKNEKDVVEEFHWQH